VLGETSDTRVEGEGGESRIRKLLDGATGGGGMVFIYLIRKKCRQACLVCICILPRQLPILAAWQALL
jgi:hypothetical protein